jgi:cell division transport system permease protein
MRLSYLAKTCARHFIQTWLSSVLSVFTIMFFLVLIGFFGLAWLNINQLLDSLSSRVQIHAYVSNTLDDGQTVQLGSRLQNLQGVQRIEFISKEAAAREFQKEFGKELFNILQENPLPASFVVLVREEYRTEVGIKNVVACIQGEAGIDEVVSHYKTFSLLNRYAATASRLNLGLFLFVTSGSLLLVANTIRLVIGSQKSIIETMRLVGATAGFIRLPLVLEGLCQGLLGGTLALLVLQWIVSMVVEILSGFSLQGLQYGYWLILMGGFWGLLGSWIGIKRYL